MCSASAPTASPAAKARALTSAPGNSRPPGQGRPRGFTIIELLIVVALVAVASGIVTLALRDPAANQLDHEAMRLATLLEAARAESRAMGVPVRFALGPARTDKSEGAFHFDGLPESTPLPTRWLDPEVQAEIVGAKHLTLGPEPLIGAQRIVLRLHGRSLTLMTDGLVPFAPLDPDQAASEAKP